MNEPLKQHRTLEDWAKPRTVIRGPYSAGNEPENDRLARIAHEEAHETAKLVMRVIWCMAGLIFAFVVWSIWRRL